MGERKPEEGQNKGGKGMERRNGKKTEIRPKNGQGEGNGVKKVTVNLGTLNLTFF